MPSIARRDDQRFARARQHGNVLGEHLESGREALPRLDTAPYEFEGIRLYLSGQLLRPALEAEADAILAAAGFFDEDPVEDEVDLAEPLSGEGEFLGTYGGDLEEGGNEL